MKTRYIVTYIILMALQVIFGGLLNLSQYVVVCFLPVMIMSLPITYSTPKVLLIAFVTSLVVDFFTNGVLGLSTIALLPVALTRNFTIQLVFGSELLSRKEDISIHKQGAGKVLLSILLSTSLYFLVFVPVDCAGTRPLSFVTLRILISVAISTAVSYYVAGVLSPREADRWN
ncbi:MAG: hypothetical protein K6F21_02410 [Bacteroidales bacterium]|nr:hypothetical protein [Bacteroidales bacterium]